jgi:hypothetical protein
VQVNKLLGHRCSRKWPQTRSDTASQDNWMNHKTNPKKIEEYGIKKTLEKPLPSETGYPGFRQL